jgi:hypothetical protein
MAHPAGTHSRHKKTPVVAEVPQAPSPPPTLEQSAPTPPQISYRDGQLTIDARNSTLSQVLRGVQAQTGATMEIPAGASNDRVVAQLGPGQPRDVLNTLLNGSKFDYVILGVTGNPGAVQRVILTPRQASGAAPTNTAQNNSSPNAGEGPSSEEEPQPDEGTPVADTSADNQPEQAPPPPGGFRRPMPGGGQPVGEPGSPFGPGESQNVVKTPEQLMQELQQMQQQQQQYQQQLNPANQNPPQ